MLKLQYKVLKHVRTWCHSLMIVVVLTFVLFIFMFILLCFVLLPLLSE